jgi:hypothetical protein
MKCKFCNQQITRTQIARGDAVRLADGVYHTDCLDDQQRERDDAYYRDANGKRVNQR